MHASLRKYIDTITSSVMSDEEFKHLEEAFVPKVVKRRQFLLHEGSVCKYLSFVVKGAMRQYYIDDKGVEHIVRFGIEEWWMSDRQSFTLSTPSKYNIDAVEDCELLMVSSEKLALLKERSPLYTKMGQVLDERSYFAAENRIQVTISYTAEEKVMHLMKTYPAFLQRFPQTMVASYLGLSPETLSRVRKQILSK